MSGPIVGAVAIQGGLLDNSPWSGFQKRVLAVISLAIVLDGFDNLMLGFIMPSLMREWGLTKSAFVPIVALTVVGMSIGTAGAGALGDRHGRRPLLIGSALLLSGATLLAAFSPNIIFFGVTRFVVAIGLGGAVPNAAALVADYTPLKRRNFAISLAILSVSIGGVLGGALAAEVLPHYGWRMLLALGGALPFLVAGIMIPMLPESPSFLLQHEPQGARLASILRRCGVGPEIILTSSSAPQNLKRPMAMLLTSEFRRDTLLLWLIGLCSALTIYAVFSWVPALLSAANFSLAAASLALAAFNGGGIVGALVGGWLMDRMGSRLPMMGYVAAGSLLAAFLPVIGWPTASDEYLLYAGTFALGFTFCGLQPMFTALSSGIYPPAIRASGIGAASAIGRMGAIGSALLGVGFFRLGLPEFLRTLSLVFFVAFAALFFLRRHSAATAGLNTIMGRQQPHRQPGYSDPVEHLPGVGRGSEIH